MAILARAWRSLQSRPRLRDGLALALVLFLTGAGCLTLQIASWDAARSASDPSWGIGWPYRFRNAGGFTGFADWNVFALAADLGLFFGPVLLTLGVLHVVPSAIAAVVARRRARRGLCPRCSYDVQGDWLSGCPECGWNRVPPSADRATALRSSVAVVGAFLIIQSFSYHEGAPWTDDGWQMGWPLRFFLPSAPAPWGVWSPSLLLADVVIFAAATRVIVVLARHVRGEP
jgi:hypothetical protein